MIAAITILAICSLYLTLGVTLVRGVAARAEGARCRVWWAAKGDETP